MSSSIAVRQFMALACGEMEIRAPRLPFRVAAVSAQERYCLRCYGIRTMDVVFKQTTMGGMLETAIICRACGKVLAYPGMARVHWIGGG